MDAFWPDELVTFRRRAREYFRREGAALSRDAAGAAEKIGRDLDFAPATGQISPFPRRLRLSEGVLIIEEASFHRPRLGRDLVCRWRSGEAAGSAEERLYRLARLVGTAAHILEAGVPAARERGYFSSSLMGFRDVQERLAGLISGIESLRLGVCRVCHLLDSGDRERAEAESIPLYEKGMSLDREARSLALALLGKAWTGDNLPEDEALVETERNRS